MKRILLLLPNGFEVLEVAAIVDVIGWSNIYGNKRDELLTTGRHSQIHDAFGSPKTPDMQLLNVDTGKFDAIVLPGGFEPADYYEDAFSEEVLAIIRDFRVAGKLIASICVGALPLAKSGVLSGSRATTYFLRGEKRKEQLEEMGAILVKERLIREGNVITSASPATSTEVAINLLEFLTSRENATDIRELMGFGE